MAKHTTNIFRFLTPEDEEISEEINLKRKVTKKLREIESLKKKQQLTDSEKEKVYLTNYLKHSYKIYKL